MRKPANGRQLAIDILARSTCAVKVGSCIADKHGIVSWGWNFIGYTGYGCHSEVHCIQRANKRRFAGATLYVASVRGRNGKAIISKPCFECNKLIQKWGLKVEWRDSDGNWIKL